MSKVITFSRFFPAYHPKAGQPTYFAEKVMASIADSLPGYEIPKEFTDWDWYKYYNAVPKHHTIRSGHRWKSGEWFSPRVWGADVNPKSGRSGPYQSKMIVIAPNIEIKKVFSIEFINSIDSEITGYDKGFWCKVNDVIISDFWLNEMAINDGLDLEDMIHWFNVKPNETFNGQLICWNENINYLYIIIEEVFGRVTGKDENGNAGYHLNYKPKEVTWHQ